MDIDVKFIWLENMDFDMAKGMMLGHHPFFLYPYYLNGKNMMMTHDLNPNRIHVKVENNIIVQVNGCG